MKIEKSTISFSGELDRFSVTELLEEIKKTDLTLIKKIDLGRQGIRLIIGKEDFRLTSSEVILAGKGTLRYFTQCLHP